MNKIQKKARINQKITGSYDENLAVRFLTTANVPIWKS